MLGMVPYVKVLATKSDNLSSSPRAPVVKKETYPKIVPWGCLCTYTFSFGFFV